MAQRFFFLFFLLISSLAFSQIGGNDYQKKYNSKRALTGGADGPSEQDMQLQFDESKKSSKLLDSVSIEMYKFYTVARDSSYVDTTLTIQKEYKVNFLRKDYFELLPFSNTGHAFNRLGYDFSKTELLSGLGARSKHTAYVEADQTLYYYVPTPLTELMFRTTFEQGQMANSTIAVNLSPQFNFAFAYKGSRSLGKYVHYRSANERFEFSFNYKSLNERYVLLGHYANQSVENQENGGLNREAIILYKDDDPEFRDRSLLDVRIKTAENRLAGKRSFLDHNWNLVAPKDSVTTKILLGHRFLNESRYYNYTDTSPIDHYGDLVFGTNTINDFSRLRRTSNQIYTEFNTRYTGKLRAGISAVQSNYFFEIEEEGLTDEETLPGDPSQIETTQYLLNGDWKFQWNGFSMQALLQKSVGGTLLSDEISAQARYQFLNKTTVTGRASFRNQTPDFNFQLYKSNYEAYNWYNPDLENQKTLHFSLNLDHPWLGEVYAHWQQLNNYTYFNTTRFRPEDEDPDVDRGSVLYVAPEEIYLAAPEQETNTLNYIKIRYSSEFKIRKFALTNTLQYQRVSGTSKTNTEEQVSQALNVPEWNLRTTLSYSSNVFKKAMFVQAGITGQYFTSYYADRYNPLLGDFSRQDQELIGDFPRLDFFINGRVQRTRLYLKAEHFNTLFMEPTYLSAPGYPYRDFVIRFGLVWNFFQ